jgi:hypothetical protein
MRTERKGLVAMRHRPDGVPGWFLPEAFGNTGAGESRSLRGGQHFVISIIIES